MTEPLVAEPTTDPLAPTVTPPLPPPTPAQMPPRAAEPSQQPAQAVEDVASLPDWAQKIIRDTRAEAARTRTDPRRAAEAARQEVLSTIADALGLDTEDPTPEELTARLEEARESGTRAGVELAVFRTAARHGADADALLDSVEFLRTLDELFELDPASDEFAQAVTDRITKAIERNPAKYSTAAGQAPASAPPGQAPGPRPDPSQGPKPPSPPPRPASLHEAIQAHYQPKA